MARFRRDQARRSYRSSRIRSGVANHMESNSSRVCGWRGGLAALFWVLGSLFPVALFPVAFGSELPIAHIQAWPGENGLLLA